MKNMVTLRKFKNPRNKLIYVEAEDLDTIQKNKGNDSVNEIIAELIHQKAESIRLEKNVIAPNNGAIRMSKPNYNSSRENKNLSLDVLLLSTRDLTEEIVNLNDRDRWFELKNKGHVIETVSTTMIRKSRK